MKWPLFSHNIASSFASTSGRPFTWWLHPCQVVTPWPLAPANMPAASQMSWKGKAMWSISVKLATMALLHISYWVENGKVYQKREISVQLKMDVFSTIYPKLFTHRPPLGWGGTRDKAPSCASSVTGRRLFTPFLPGSLPHTQPASGSLEALVGGQEQEPGPAPPELWYGALLC